MPRPKPNPLLRRLDALVGEWTIVAIVDGKPVGGQGRTRFEWRDGESFLVQHADVEFDETTPAEWVAGSPFPVTTIIGLDDTAEQFTMLYADARGVFRVYEMSLGDGVWRIWREAPGFHQRFVGTFNDSGTVITARWEASPDGTDWALDFDLTYTKI